MDTLPESVTMSTSASQDASDARVAAETAETAALRKLSTGEFDVADLPQARVSPLWGRIETAYGLTLEELSALQNLACSAFRGVLPRVGGDGTIYKIHDERIRAQFTISNYIHPHHYTMHAELLVDSGAMTELRLPARKVLQLGLRPLGRPVFSRGTTNHVCFVMIFSPVLVKVTFNREGVEETVEAYLDVKCDKREYDDLVAAQPAAGLLLGDPYITPTAHVANSGAAPANNSEPITEVRLSPVKHRPMDYPLQQAVIGIDGLKKLRLHLNCELQQLEIEEDEVVLEDGDEVLEDGEW
jgi:hypothetical protein